MNTQNQHTEWKFSVHPSKPNNPDVANAFFRTEMIESWGRGIEKIIDLCVSVGLPKPVFDTRFGGLQIECVPNPENEGSKTSGKMSGKIISTLIKNPDATIPEMAEQIGISQRSIERNLQNLQKAKKIERVGPANGGYWKVIE